MAAIEDIFTIRGSSGKPMVTVQLTDESMYFTSNEDGRSQQVVIADISEARDLRDWLTKWLLEIDG